MTVCNNDTLRVMQLQDLPQVYRWVHKDFPPLEYPPLAAMRSHMRRGAVAGYLRGNDYAFVVRAQEIPQDLLLLLAVDKAQRGTGRGSALVTALLQSDRGMYVEVEDPALADTPQQADLCRRRIAFYERLGFAWVNTVDYTIFTLPMRLYYRPAAGQPMPAAQQAMADMRTIYYPILRPMDRHFLQMRAKNTGNGV